ncbi:MAG: hypothetical protein KAX15_02715 [Candidatus Omnitrophica bacterium]|nr:hypothetical protein [Candidatus Omnitrophota bacterium]
MPTKRDIQIKLKLKDDFSKKHRTAMQKMRRVSRSVTTFMRQHWLKFAAAIAGATYAIIRGIKSATQYVLELDKMAKQADITTEQFARLAYAAEQEHASLESLTKIFPILTKYMEYSRQGQEMYAREFRKMGIDVADASGKLKTTHQVFMEMADYYSTAEDKTKALAIATTLLGRRGAEIVPLLKLGRAGLEKLGDEAERLGLVVDKETAAAFKKFDDQLTKIRLAFKGMWIKVATKTMGDMAAMAKKFDEVDWDGIAQHIAFILKGTGKAAGILYKISEYWADLEHFGPQTGFGKLSKDLREAYEELDKLEKGNFTLVYKNSKKFADNLAKARLDVKILEESIEAMAKQSADVRLGRIPATPEDPKAIPPAPGPLAWMEQVVEIRKKWEEEWGKYYKALPKTQLAALNEMYEQRIWALGKSVELDQWYAAERKKIMGDEDVSSKEKTALEARVRFQEELNLKLIELRDGDTAAQLAALEQQVEKWRALYGSDGELARMISDFYQLKGDEIRTAEKKLNQWQVFAAERTYNAMADSFKSIFVGTLKGELQTAADYFNAFRNSMINMIAEIMAKWAAMKLLGVGQGSAGGGGGGLGGLLGGIFKGIFGFHQGGMIRAHNGLAIDEIPIIAQSGEGVLSRRGMANLGGSGALNRLNRGQEERDEPQTVIHNHYNVQAFDVKSFSDYLEENKGAVSNAMMGAMDDNHPSRRGM